ncbi:type III pantothenate kinase [Kamptonema cortianum]|nr:type III pantothenate kinase [Geitlerinema splendidum]MDK3158394.1 type III pantothenate kinase [Kamptonema cortianum]
MLWAIDVGNTQTHIALWDGSSWAAQWRIETILDRTEDELAGSLATLCQVAGVPFAGEGVICASVVPSAEVNWSRFAAKYLQAEIRFLRDGASVGVSVTYEPIRAVGADRIANALGGLLILEPPFIVVDFGTATTLDCVDGSGTYVGGAIMPGVLLSMQSLAGGTAKLPPIAIEAPERAIGRSTVESLQSGLVLGYSGGIDSLIRQASSELDGKVTVVATGGLGKVFVELCSEIESYQPMLTVNGLVEAWTRLTKA